MIPRAAEILLTGAGSVSAAGADRRRVREFYERGASALRRCGPAEARYWAAPVHASDEQVLCKMAAGHELVADGDRSAKLAVWAALQAVEQAEWRASDGALTAVNIGCSRGATEALEHHHASFLKSASGRCGVLVSPVTTGGSVASAVAQAIMRSGAAGAPIGFSHSATCSSALAALGNALAWLGSGMAERFVVGGAEAPLTAFTISQMKALRIYASGRCESHPCRPLAEGSVPGAGMVLGEGAAVFCLERADAARRERPALAKILGFGSAAEKLRSLTGISEEGENFRLSMQEALRDMRGREVDLVIMHAPGTALGDAAELSAIRAVFGDLPPILLSNKWQIGHTLGASGALSVEYALHILHSGTYSNFPYEVSFQNRPRPVRTVMVNSAGFGGNAVSVILGV